MDNYEYTELLKNITIKIGNITGVVEPEKIKKRLNEIEELENDQEFWNDASNAAKIQKEKTQLQRKLDKYDLANNAVNDAVELYEMAKEENDEESIQSLYEDAPTLQNQIRGMEIEVLLSGDSDSNNAILSIHPGAGGTESQDWAEMLLRMYKKWAERRGFSVEVLDYQNGDEAGIKDASIMIKGENDYGYLKVENGIHRLVRISPFDSNAKRHTSFSSVMVSPEVSDDIDIVIEDKDIRIDTYRASGAGGQHVNKTESAIRITHIETNIVVQCQNDRSQHKNKATAMNQLRAKLYEYEMQQRNADKQVVEDNKSDIGWGSQIRSYVLDQSRIKDLRTNVETGNTQAVLDGDLDQFIEASLKSGL